MIRPTFKINFFFLIVVTCFLNRKPIAVTRRFNKIVGSSVCWTNMKTSSNHWRRNSTENCFSDFKATITPNSGERNRFSFWLIKKTTSNSDLKEGFLCLYFYNDSVHIRRSSRLFQNRFITVPTQKYHSKPCL